MNTELENQTSNLNSTSARGLSAGKALREAREQQGLTVNDVANRIKFAPKQIEWLEDDDYVRLPEAAFVRGFVRSYARLLELDPAHLLSALPLSHVQPASTKEIKSVEVVMPSSSGTRRYNIILLVAGLAIALSVALFERMHTRTPEKAPTVANTKVEELQLPGVPVDGASAPVSEQQQAAEEPAPAQQLESGAPAMTPQPTASAKKTVKTPANVSKQTEPKQLVVSAPVREPQAVVSRPPKKASGTQEQQGLPRAMATPAAPAIVAGGAAAAVNAETGSADHSLRLELDEDAWVEVKDGSDRVLVSKMHSAGSLVRITGKAPLLVIIGNARAVRLFDNGKKINLERYTTAEVARVKLK